MFFIPPRNEPPNSHESGLDEAPNAGEPSKKRKRLFRAPEDFAGYYPKRTPKACDRCRLKKVRCSGGQVCERCAGDGVVCVTTSATGRDSAPINPERLHLAESQRDRLAQILSKILQRQDETEATKLREIVTSMGLSTQSLFGAHDATSSPVDFNPATFDEVPQDVWLELYDELSGFYEDSFPLPYAEDPSTTLGISANVVPAPGVVAADQNPFNEPMQFEDMIDLSPFNPTDLENSHDHGSGASAGALGALRPP